MQDGLIFSSERVVIPKKPREARKQNVHVIGKRESAYFGPICPRRWKSYENHAKRAGNCAQPKETLKSMKVTKQPWGRIATELFLFKDEKFLVTVPMTKPEN